MKYYIIAGEASGDLHASNLLKEIRKRDPKANIRAWGGDLMAAQGASIVKHYRDLAFMGFAEVLMNLRTILRNLEFCKKDLLEFNPDVLILVDYPGFNLRIAQFAHKNGIRVHYYISPQLWAWKKGRVHTIKKVVDKMMVILPFEKDFYDGYGYHVDFVGHPLLDAIAGKKKNQDFKLENQLGDKPIIALLPGSRKQEISLMLKTMLQLTESFNAYQFVVAGAPSVEASFYHALISKRDIALVQNKTYDLLQYAEAAMVTSGTATLETALFGVPQVVCYKGNPLSFEIAKRVVKVPYISLVNLVMGREVVTELIQYRFTAENLKTELNRILDQENRSRMLNDYALLRDKLGGEGASAKAAQLVLADLGL